MGRIEWKERVFNPMLECFQRCCAVCGDLLWKYHPDLSQQNNSPPCGEEPGLSLWVRYWGRRMFVCCLYYRALKLESVNVSFVSAKTRVKSLSVAKWAYILSSSGSLFSSLIPCLHFPLSGSRSKFKRAWHYRGPTCLMACSMQHLFCREHCIVELQASLGH